MESLDLSRVRTNHGFTYLAVTHAIFVIMGLALTVFWEIHGALILAAPSIVILASAAFGDRVVAPGVSVRVDRPRALEGDVVTVSVTLKGAKDAALVDVEFRPDKNLEFRGSLRALTSLSAGHDFTANFQIIVDEWGVVPVGHVHVRVRDRFGLTSLDVLYQVVSTIRVHIHEEVARSLIEPDRFRRLVGSHLSPERGDGCEIADVRPYQPGDRLQALNWRISARNDEPWVTLRHPDRSTTVVLLLDAYQRFGNQRADGLKRSIRATLGLTRLHLSAQDPVGVMLVGQGVRWFKPQLGRLHLHRVTDAMLDLSTNQWSEQHQSKSVVHRLIPKDAIVIAVSSLVDGRFLDVITSLRGRGQSVHVIEPVTYWPEQIVARRGRVDFTPEMAWRIYSLQQQVVRSQLAQAGVPVIPWDEDQPIDAALLGLRLHQRARSAGGVR